MDLTDDETPKPLSDAVRSRMRSQRRVDTKPEALVRRLLWAKGFRYRVSLPVPGKPRRSIDIAFPAKRLAVFVDGCFWHRCPEHSVAVKNNAEWWEAKLSDNVRRDRETTAILEEQGWRVLRLWEHTPASEACHMIERVLIEMEHAP